MRSLSRPVAALAFALFVAAGCKEEAPAAREVVRPVKTFRFGDAARELQFAYPGRVYANLTVDVGFEVPGKLDQLPVVRGQNVAAGDLLARLDQRDYLNGLSAAQAAFDEAKATYERYKIAADSGAVAKQQLDETKARMDVTDAQLKISQKAFDDTEIRADFSGVVADRYAENYDNVVAKQAILSLQDISHLEIRINIPESDMVRAGTKIDGEVVGDDLTARFAAVAGREFDLEVKEFSTEADPVTQTFLVTLLMANPDDAEVLPGMTATVRWKPASAGSTALTVPATAVGGLPDGGESFVWIVDEGAMKVSRRVVTVGQLVSGGMLEIRDGLELGDVVASAGVWYLEEGMTVSRYAPLGDR